MRNYFLLVIRAQAGIQANVMPSFAYETKHIKTQPKLDSRLRANDGG